jgi:hypothetical protein
MKEIIDKNIPRGTCVCELFDVTKKKDDFQTETRSVVTRQREEFFAMQFISTKEFLF